MDLLKREMERKKKALQEAKKKAGAGGVGVGRYVKAGDLRRHQEEQEEQELVLLSRKRQAAAAAAAAVEEQESTRTSKRQSSPSIDQETTTTTKTSSASDSKPSHAKKQKKDKQTSATVAEDDDVDNNAKQQTQSSSSSASSSSLADIQKQLRALGLPVTLFGEGHSDRARRLQQAQRALRENQLDRSEADEFRLGQGHGIRNPFLERDRHAHYEDQEAALHAEAVAALKPKRKDRAGAAGSEKTNSKIDDEADKKKERDKQNEHGDDETDPHKVVYKHFKGLIRQWEADLNARPDQAKRTVAGRNETKTLKQCKDYIRPLFQLCKRRQLEDNMLLKLEEMVRHCRAGDFVRAHDAYMDLAIGRAAWPIGVTQVGIHSRTGREKIGAANVAHVMNSELQRKYLTSVKRLLTYEQTKRTDVDPSRKVS